MRIASSLLLFAIWLTAFLPSAAAADSAAVTRIAVNGTMVTSDVAPFVEQHRVVVPMRAVFTALGGYVMFDAPSKTVIVARPHSTIELRIFSQRADVNGNTVWLDEPAIVRDGRTMVPLRFIAEASGADVSFDEVRNVVGVTLSGIPGATLGSGDVTGTIPAIKSMSVDTHGKQLLVTGDVLQVSIIGTPGASASFDLAGVVAGVEMHEISRGTYTGFYVVRAGRNVSGVNAYGHLSFEGHTAYAASGTTFSIVGRSPSVVSSAPASGERTFVGQPAISAAIDDHGGPAVDANSLRVFLDDSDVTSYSGVSSRSVYFTPYYPLAPGWHRVGVYGSDVAGIPFSSDWSFFVEPSYQYAYYGGACCSNPGSGFGNVGYPIYSVSPLQFGTFGPGSVITMVLQGYPGGYAIVNFIGMPGSVYLSQVGGMPGYYVGSYTVPPGINLWPVDFDVTYFGANGQTVHARQGTGLRFVASTATARNQPVVRRPAFASGTIAAARLTHGPVSIPSAQPVAKRPSPIRPLPVMRLPPIATPRPQPTPRPVVTPHPIVTPRPVVTPRPIATPRPVVTPHPIVTPRPLPTIAPPSAPTHLLKTPQPAPVQPPAPHPIVTPRPTPRPTPTPLPSPASSPLTY